MIYINKRWKDKPLLHHKFIMFGDWEGQFLKMELKVLISLIVQQFKPLCASCLFGTSLSRYLFIEAITENNGSNISTAV